MDDGTGYTYDNGDYYEYETGIMYYADGHNEQVGSTVTTPIYSMAPAATDPDLQMQAADAAEGGWLDSFSENLLKLGTTAAQLAMLYQNVQSSKQLTPVALQNLAQERAYLQTQTQSSQTMWMWVAVAAGVGLVLMRERRAA